MTEIYLNNINQQIKELITNKTLINSGNSVTTD